MNVDYLEGDGINVRFNYGYFKGSTQDGKKLIQILDDMLKGLKSSNKEIYFTFDENDLDLPDADEQLNENGAKMAFLTWAAAAVV